jgi:VanZ family protein
MTAFVASLDEWHQSFIPSRTGTPRDVALDTCAGIAAQVLIFFWLKRKRRVVGTGAAASRAAAP